MMISIIIPALNEEKYIPRLLESIKIQNYKDYEIIVADAGSRDKTTAIARKYGAKVVQGGLPAVGRNNGERSAKGEFLLFLDADVVLPRNFLYKLFSEVQTRFIDLATCEMRPLSNFAIDKALHGFANTYMKLTRLSDPHAPGFCIFVTKRLFERIGGFNESLKLAEDHDFVKRASKFRSFHILTSPFIHISVRRFDKEGRIGIAKKYFQVELYRLFKGPVNTDVFSYEYGNFAPKKKEKLLEIDRKLQALNKDYKIFKGDFKEKYSKYAKITKDFEKIIKDFKRIISP